MGQSRRIERTRLPPTIDASTMTEWVIQFFPANKAEAIKLLRASFAECPLSMRVAIIDMLMRGWPRKDARHSPR
jgi:hypothetical protein